MRRLNSCRLFSLLLLLTLAACGPPLSQEAREHINSDITLEKVSDNPADYLNQKILLGGAIVANDELETGSLLEVLQWQINALGEPTHLEDDARRFLLRTEQWLDPTIYEPGVLITLAGTVLGEERRSLEQHEDRYPLIGLIEIHLWESPYRYGIYRNLDPGYPNSVQNSEALQRNPYDPGYIDYPYTQFWYRNTPR